MSPDSSPPSSSRRSKLRESLSHLGLPPNFISSVYEQYESCDCRLFLLDNSSRMKVRDSHVGRGGTGTRYSESDNIEVERVDSVSRWEELEDCVAFQVRMASGCWIPTKFLLVHGLESDHRADNANQHSKFTVCWGRREDVRGECERARDVMRGMALDRRSCPLAALVRKVRGSVAKEAPRLEVEGKKITVVVCTQGRITATTAGCRRQDSGKSSSSHQSDGGGGVQELRCELEKLSKMPVKIILRICTDDEEVLEDFNEMDKTIDSVDVLDDFWGEAHEVFLHNPWLTYSMGMHRLRESGLAPSVMGDLDERPLRIEEVHDLCKLLLLGNDGLIDLPNPTKDRENFFRTLQILVEKEEPQWCPIKKSARPWIDVRRLEAMHGGGHSANGGHRSGGHGQHNDRQPRRNDRGHTFAPGQRAPQWMQRDQEDPPRRQHNNSRKMPTGLRHRHRSEGFVSSPPQAGLRHRSEAFVSSVPPQARLTLPEVIKRWSHRAPGYKEPNPLARLLVTVPSTFPPTNTAVEPHDYFSKWKSFDEEAFDVADCDELKELLKRAVRKAKFFLHPDKLPKDATANQNLLFKGLWGTIMEQEATSLG